MWQDLSRMGGEKGREDGQKKWHEYIGQRFPDKQVLDVGSGLGLVKQRIPNIITQDIAPGLEVDIVCPVEGCPAESANVVTAFDVIEHVEKDVSFVSELFRITRQYVFITTPNFEFWNARNPYHVREYTPLQLRILLTEKAKILKAGKEVRIAGMEYFIGKAYGEIVPVKHGEFVKHTAPHHAILAWK